MDRHGDVFAAMEAIPCARLAVCISLLYARPLWVRSQKRVRTSVLVHLAPGQFPFLSIILLCVKEEKLARRE